MKSFAFTLLSMCLFWLPLPAGAQQNPANGDASARKYSVWMVASEMQRTSHPYLLDFAKKPRWSYCLGLELEAMLDVYLAYGNEDIKRYLAEYPEKMIAPDGTIATYKLADYNLDQVRTGKFVWRFNKVVPRQGNEIAVDTLFRQLMQQPRTRQGVWFHKQIYHDQVWLDGIFMGQPFYVNLAPEQSVKWSSGRKAAKRFTRRIYDDAVSQIMSTAEKTYDARTGLWRHAWDESHRLFWANPETGQSAHTWGRAMGWFVMAITEVLDALPDDYARKPKLIALYDKVAHAIMAAQDERTGLWWDVMDQPGRKGNYLESTCSAMFAYAFLHGSRMGYLGDDVRAAGKRAYEGIIKNFIREDADGTISLTDCCEVSGLGPETNRRRDGSFEYYISEPIRDNDSKGIGPFIWASLEMERE